MTRDQHLPRWWAEISLVVVVYAAYATGRVLAGGDVATAVDRGVSVLRLEQLFSLNFEHPLNRLLTEHAWLGIPADFVYASFHYLITAALLVWLFRRHGAHYRSARTWLLASTFIALIGFALLPTSPPRLLDADYGFVDTMAQYSSYGWWGGAASAPSGLAGLTNQYAAMPSLHVGWALWCGVVLWRYGRKSHLKRVLAVGYPLLIVLVVLGTANHYFLDAVAGALVMGLGYVLARPVTRLADRFTMWVRARAVSVRCQTSPGDAVAPPLPRQTDRDSAADDLDDLDDLDGKLDGRPAAAPR